MKLSIIIPAYNEESTIEEIIAKVRAASLPEGISREIVIVNDGSKDRTADILSRFSGQRHGHCSSKPSGQDRCFINRIQKCHRRYFADPGRGHGV